MTAASGAEPQRFGRHAPGPLMAGLLRLSRRCPSGWLGKRLAFALRALGIRMLGGAPLDVATWGVRMRLHPAHNTAEKNLLFTPQYFDPAERALLARRLSGAFTFVDIGANAGGYSLFAASLAGSGARILAVEPQADIFERLVYNIQQNSFSCIKALACAVADQDGDITLFVDERNKGETSMRVVHGRVGGREVRVPARSLLDILKDEHFDRVDALKIDVEGAEELVFEPFFRAADPGLWPRLIIMEMAPTRWAVDLPALIRQQGYREIMTTRMNVVFERA